MIFNLYIYEKNNQYIYVHKLITVVCQQLTEIVVLIDRKRMYYNKIVVEIEDKKEYKIIKDLLKDRYKAAFYTANDNVVKLI